ncbi:TlpA family protein disulfide reductase [Streptomyces sp. NPDC059917]|uniref:TlpA family protein disulfide reductase n=1 Tax=Streptomyces sp. NPDC059917 TaxID=3347002 RepID=UPI00365714DB
MNTTLSLLALAFASVALLLSVAVARRTKQVLDGQHDDTAARPVVPVGKQFPQDTPLTGLRGEAVPLGADQRDPVLLGVFSAGCAGCADQLPVFKERIRRHHVERGRVVSFVVGEGPLADEFVRELDDVGSVVRQDVDGPVLEPLGVRNFPAFGVVDASGQVVFWANQAPSLDDVLDRFAGDPEVAR